MSPPQTLPAPMLTCAGSADMAGPSDFPMPEAKPAGVWELTTDPEISECCPPLASEELAGLEEQLRAAGCLAPLIVWKCGEQAIILDGHNRYRLCTAHGIPFRVIEMVFPDRAAAL